MSSTVMMFLLSGDLSQTAAFQKETAKTGKIFLIGKSSSATKHGNKNSFPKILILDNL